MSGMPAAAARRVIRGKYADRFENPDRRSNGTNPEPATGGRDTETVQNALVRGPQELHSLQRAVTASDFELLALRSSGAVARAKAFTKAMLWKHAPPGTIEVLLVPNVPEQQRPNGAVTLEAITAQETDEAKQTIRRALDNAVRSARFVWSTGCITNKSVFRHAP